MADLGAKTFVAKFLAPNDNSKNQIYLGSGFGALNIVPHGEIEIDPSDQASAIRDRAKAKVDFLWLESNGVIPAPHAQLILYPKYPEVRMSGFLKGTKTEHGGLMRSRDEGRILLLGICPDQRAIGYAVSGQSAEARFLIEHKDDFETSGVFVDLGPIFYNQDDSRELLLKELKRIHTLGWIQAQKLNQQGDKEPYHARNAGGYTLEAELGISPNGYSEPDFEGWELKQYGVRDFINYRPKSPITLMTPEPTGGIYQSEGLFQFLNKFGYADQSGIPDRQNFGGRYTVNGDFHHLTKLKLVMHGYDFESKKITDLDGEIALIDSRDQIAASWKFRSIIDHWRRKHAKTAYVPSLSKKTPLSYRFGAQIELCEGTDVLLFFAGFANGFIYYDPAIKMTDFYGPTPKSKRRSQFRVSHGNLQALYKTKETIDLLNSESS